MVTKIGLFSHKIGHSWAYTKATAAQIVGFRRLQM